jgi:hypothetical protein
LKDKEFPHWKNAFSFEFAAPKVQKTPVKYHGAR